MFDTTAAPTPTAALPDDNDVVAAVVRAVADAEEVSPLELGPLARVIDPDALDSLVESLPTASDPDSAGLDASTVSFDYSGYRVTVDGDCTVTLSASQSEH